VEDHFADVREMVTITLGQKEIPDVMLTRYACYLIAQNGDPRERNDRFCCDILHYKRTKEAELIEQDF
jgi:DNA-damage-inducible protein D